MAPLNRRLPWQRLNPEQLIAATVALMLNAAAVWFLARYTVLPPSPVAEEEITQVVFIERVPKRVPTVMELPEAKRSSARLPPMAAKPPGGARPLQVTMVSHDDEMVSTKGRPLDLSVTDNQPISFERDPLARRVPSVESPQRSRFVFTERSFGGVMQRMTKASICRDLRAVLNASPANADQLIAEMKSYGCKV